MYNHLYSFHSGHCTYLTGEIMRSSNTTSTVAAKQHYSVLSRGMRYPNQPAHLLTKLVRSLCVCFPESTLYDVAIIQDIVIEFYIGAVSMQLKRRSGFQMCISRYHKRAIKYFPDSIYWSNEMNKDG